MSLGRHIANPRLRFSNPRLRFSNPRLRLFAGAIMISFSPVWVKLVDVSPTTSGFYRLAIGGVALALFLLATGTAPDIIKACVANSYSVRRPVRARYLVLASKHRLCRPRAGHVCSPVFRFSS